MRVVVVLVLGLSLGVWQNFALMEMETNFWAYKRAYSTRKYVLKKHCHMWIWFSNFLTRCTFGFQFSSLKKHYRIKLDWQLRPYYTDTEKHPSSLAALAEIFWGFGGNIFKWLPLKLDTIWQIPLLFNQNIICSTSFLLKVACTI